MQLLLTLVGVCSLWRTFGQTADTNPVRKVVTLLEDMKAQVEKEAKEDANANENFMCWCKTNKNEKNAAVEAAQAKISELEAFIEKAAGLEAQLKTEIEALESDIAEDQDSLATATALKDKETAEYKTTSADLKECIAALKEALAVLAKVQLLQKSGHKVEVKPLLVQVKQTLSAMKLSPAFGGFRGVMQRDMWDMLSSIDAASGVTGSFLPRGHTMSTLEQKGQINLDQPIGNAAGAKSYNSRSGSIVGILSEMRDEFERDLAAADKRELEAVMSFQKLRATKLAEIASATTQKKAKSTMLAETQAKAAQAKEDLVATSDALSADQKFLVDLEETCSTAANDYDARVKVRSEELQALGEAIKILTEDEARDLWGKTFAFVQIGTEKRLVGGDQHSKLATAVAAGSQSKVINLAMKRILKTAWKHKNWVLASLAVRVRMDKFAKVKEMMDKMVMQLKEQQKADDTKLAYCQKEIDETEDNIKVGNNEKDDLESKKLGLENSMSILKADIETLEAEVADMKVSLKKSGEDRKAENLMFQQSIGDQRATIQILKKALARLEAFYKTKSLVQLTGHAKQHQTPGTPNAPPPSTMTYEKSAGAGGVIQLINMVINDATRTETELVADEQHAQEEYASLAADFTATINADNEAIIEKTKLLEQATAEKAQTEGDLLTNTEQLEKLTKTLSDLHLDCDFVLKYYQVRKTARSEEIGSIVEAKAILSGADFGKAMEEGDDAESA